MRPGARVTTPYGPGTVAYVRMDGTKPVSVSVVLDARRSCPGYYVTVMPAKGVAVVATDKV